VIDEFDTSYLSINLQQLLQLRLKEVRFVCPPMTPQTVTTPALSADGIQAFVICNGESQCTVYLGSKSTGATLWTVSIGSLVLASPILLDSQRCAGCNCDYSSHPIPMLVCSTCLSLSLPIFSPDTNASLVPGVVLQFNI
jgi:hypothetical protein